MKFFPRFLVLLAICANGWAAESGIERLIEGEESSIAGTLLLPEGSGENIPLVIMISGSGAQSRDSEVLGFPIFSELAARLREAGIASFRYDDRGVGGSTGDFAEATLDRLAADVAVLVDHFKVFSGRNFSEIILLGHSQGGIVAGRLASLDARIDRVILMASSGMNLRRILRQQVEDAFAGNELPAELIEEEILAREQIMYAIADEEDVEAARDAYQAVYERLLAQLPRQARAQISDPRALAEQQATQLVAAFSVPQMQSLLFHDPVVDLQGLSMPVLMLFGERDTQVREALNRPLMEAALSSAGSEFESVVIAEANHLFQKAGSGSPAEYASLEKQFAPGFTEAIVAWVKQGQVESTDAP